jgi:radical SAM superfamily enzyme YgiQ (UPF0313 family)
LRSKGFDVRLADLQFSGPSEIEKHLDSFSPDVMAVYDDGFNYLTKMCLTNMRDAALSMIETAQKRNIKVLVSSSDATDHCDTYLKHGADFVIVGEAEQTLLEVVQLLSQQKDCTSVNGLAYLQNGKVIKTAGRQVLKDLDQLPSPAWDLVDFEPYKKMWISHHGYFSINMVTTRGCPYKCNWCAKPIYGNRYNSHSPMQTAISIRQLQQYVKFDHIWFADDIFGLKPGWIKQFDESLQQLGLKIKYKIQSRADILTPEIVQHLAHSGCDEVWMGAESGSQKILDAMDKGTTTEQITEASQSLKKAGIKPCFFIQFGYPGETWTDIEQTLRMIDTLKPYDIGVSVSYPLPGTVFYENVKNQLGEKQNWQDSDELLLMFRSTYAPAFYRNLQRFVHYKFRSSQMIDSLLHRKLRSRMVLLPYYLVRKRSFKNRLRMVEPLAINY